MTTSLAEAPNIEPARSALMRRIGPKNTKPEMVVRQTLHRLGYRFRLHAKELPGRPDIVFRPRKKVIFVHGCFWHRHPGCRKSTSPKTRREFWEAKFAANQARDARVQEDLIALGWQCLIIWECETSDLICLEDRLKVFLR
ncbi:very short patch repair endonuclease [uncultured Jannaschia sp.]|uniref:very short patch repair endonuclease n=1 Tax=uncultured Jannaschia sp. TaxID=293347 RepID=UPI0026234F30|nr:very short patch repair endonuclease [uncultured Jannaschia sp.]